MSWVAEAAAAFADYVKVGLAAAGIRPDTVKVEAQRWNDSEWIVSVGEDIGARFKSSDEELCRGELWDGARSLGSVNAESQESQAKMACDAVVALVESRLPLPATIMRISEAHLRASRAV